MTALHAWSSKLLSGRDNVTPDVARWAWLLTNVAIIGAAVVVALVRGTPVSLTELVTALAITNTGAAAAATKLKESTEPQPGPLP